MLWVNILLGLAALPYTSARSLPKVRRQTQGAPYINYTQFDGHPGPVSVSVSVNSGERNQTAPLLYGW